MSAMIDLLVVRRGSVEPAIAFIVDPTISGDVGFRQHDEMGGYSRLHD
jgi:hypothetical protein